MFQLAFDLNQGFSSFFTWKIPFKPFESFYQILLLVHSYWTLFHAFFREETKICIASWINIDDHYRRPNQIPDRISKVSEFNAPSSNLNWAQFLITLFSASIYTSTEHSCDMDYWHYLFIKFSIFAGVSFHHKFYCLWTFKVKLKWKFQV